MSRLIRISAAGLLSAAVLLAAAAQSDLYRWVDEDGNVHVVSQLDMVPPQYRESALEEQRTSSGGSLSFVSEGHDSSTSAPAAPGEGSGTSVAAMTPTTFNGHGEQWWREQARQRQKNLDDLQRQRDAAKAEEDDWSSQIYSTGHHNGRAGPGGANHAYRAAVLSAASDDDDEPSLEQLDRMVAEAEVDLELFHDDARRLGVPPGWLR